MSDEREYEDFESEPSIAAPVIDTFAVVLGQNLGKGAFSYLVDSSERVNQEVLVARVPSASCSPSLVEQFQSRWVLRHVLPQEKTTRRSLIRHDLLDTLIQYFPRIRKPAVQQLGSCCVQSLVDILHELLHAFLGICLALERVVRTG